MKIANIDGKNLHIFWTTGISMRFSGKMWLMIISKVTKNQDFTLSLEDTFLEKPQGGVKGAQIDLSASILRVNKGTGTLGTGM